ncbi:MAG TPA: YsnF/AvaK domain-containing protein [Gemmatimonadales bacterium]|nr:YsnF/AvaK domain-containing protein [Gemmatimonadales bacterium]
MTAKDTLGSTTGRTAVGLFRNRADAEAAIRYLKDAGFTDEQIGVAMRDRDEQRDLIDQTGANTSSGAATGAVSGGIVGGLIGLLGSLLIPGVGPIVVGGVLASTLVGIGAGAATGGIIGGLIGMGVSEEDARYFDAGFREGGVLVSVTAPARMGDAVNILSDHGADLGPSRVLNREAATPRADQFAHGAVAARAPATDREAIELRQEELDVEKRRVEAGEVHLRKEVVTEQRTMDVPVSHEEVVIERRPATERTAASGELGEGEDITVPLLEEEVDVRKRPVVREEVNVRKQQVGGTQHIDEPLRREELRVESEGDVTIRGAGARSPYGGPERRQRAGRKYRGPERRQEATP